MALYVIGEVLRGLDAVHSAVDDRGKPRLIVHRDVSPANVIIDECGAVKLGDFGIAHASGRLTRTRTGSIKGKSRYMAPEQLTGQPVDHRADLYAVGVTLFEALLGDWRASRARTTPYGPMFTWPRHVPPDLVPPDVGEILQRAVVDDPRARFADAAQFRRAVVTALGRHAPGYDAEMLAFDLRHGLKQLRGELDGFDGDFAETIDVATVLRQVRPRLALVDRTLTPPVGLETLAVGLETLAGGLETLPVGLETLAGGLETLPVGATSTARTNPPIGATSTARTNPPIGATSTARTNPPLGALTLPTPEPVSAEVELLGPRPSRGLLLGLATATGTALLVAIIIAVASSAAPRVPAPALEARRGPLAGEAQVLPRATPLSAAALPSACSRSRVRSAPTRRSARSSIRRHPAPSSSRPATTRCGCARATVSSPAWSPSKPAIRRRCDSYEPRRRRRMIERRACRSPSASGALRASLSAYGRTADGAAPCSGFARDEKCRARWRGVREVEAGLGELDDGQRRLGVAFVRR